MPKNQKHLYDVFISYSHHDRSWVRKSLLPKLEAAGLRVCIDHRDFEIGTPSLINIERAVDNSRHTLIVLTPAWIDSTWTEFESLLVATKDPAARRRRLLPLKLISVEPPPRIDMLTYADFTDRRNRGQAFEFLLKQIDPRSKPRPTTKRVTAATPRRRAIQPEPLSAVPHLSSAEPKTFVVGLPLIHPRQFFGHGAVVKRIFNLLKRRPLQNAIITGPRRSGKTSLLLYLKNVTALAATAQDQLRPDQLDGMLPQPERYRWVFTDFQDPRLSTREGLLRYLLNSLRIAMPNRCTLEGFMDLVIRHLRGPTVVLMDEIDVALERYPELDDSFWESLRSLATTQVEGNLSFVLAASAPPSQLAQRNGIGSPFFNIFGYTVSLGPLSEPDARALIASSPLPFSAPDVNWILDRSGGWPILLQTLCRERLFTLEEGDTGADWRREGLRQIEPFQHLLDQ